MRARGAAANCFLRSAILKFHELSLSDFGNKEEAFACADKFVSSQRADLCKTTQGTELLARNPDKILGVPEADQFFYIMDQGNAGSIGWPWTHRLASRTWDKILDLGRP